MASTALPHVFGVSQSLKGRAWRWRGGNMDLGQGSLGDDEDILRQILLARGVPGDDMARHMSPTLRDFLPDPSEFNLIVLMIHKTLKK